MMSLLDYYVFSKGNFYAPFVEAIASECIEDELIPSIQYLASSRNFSECQIPIADAEPDVVPLPGYVYK